jgi:hypothetical protein
MTQKIATAKQALDEIQLKQKDLKTEYGKRTVSNAHGRYCLFCRHELKMFKQRKQIKKLERLEF